MGPFFPVRETADGLEWAHFCQSEKLLMAFNGPISADGLEWAHYCQSEKLLMALNGPIAASQSC
jgi:hypothetical protein